MKKIKATALITSALVLGKSLASVPASAATLSHSKNGASYFTSPTILGCSGDINMGCVFNKVSIQKIFDKVNSQWDLS